MILTCCANVTTGVAHSTPYFAVYDVLHTRLIFQLMILIPATTTRMFAFYSLLILPAGSGGDSLASEFSAHLNQLSLKAPLQHRRPSPLDPPTAAVAAQLDALQINDWPEPDAGVQTALAFAKPYECEQLLTAVPYQANSSSSSVMSNLPSSAPERRGDSSSSTEWSGARVRSWAAQEQWLTPQEFRQLLHSPPYDVLLGCDSWRACSGMVSVRNNGMPHTACCCAGFACSVQMHGFELAALGI